MPDAPLLAAPDPPPPALAPRPQPAPAHSKDRRAHLLGVQIDCGFPSGASLTLVYRPWKYLRLGGGVLYNFLGYGLRGSVSVLPYFPLAPSLTVEVGHYFDADAGAAISQFVALPEDVKPMLQRFGYTFVNAQLGLELGHPNWFVFFVRAGVSRVWMTVHGVQGPASALTSTGQVKVTSIADPVIQLGIPNVQVGFIFFVF